MKTEVAELGSYYRVLAEREGIAPMELASAWDPADADEVAEDFRQAFEGCAFGQKPLSVSAEVTNQSVGHRVARFFSVQANQHLRSFQVEDCEGHGYPDKKLVRLRDHQTFALELKATSLFQPRNANRLVLTSKSEKLRREFRAPIRHLLLLIAYDRAHTELWLRSARLAFLGPNTTVQVRYEASLSHQMLSGCTRTFIWPEEAGI